jgi:hypothetical protein
MVKPLKNGVGAEGVQHEKCRKEHILHPYTLDDSSRHALGLGYRTGML